MFRMWKRVQFAGVIAGLVMALAAPSVGASPGTQWRDTAGDQTPDAGLQVTQFLPNDLTVDVGDSVTWTVKSGEFHTVSFLSGSAAPPLVIAPNGTPTFNPLVAEPQGGNSYGGQGFVNSGLLFQGQSFTVSFTKAGDFMFNCLIHPGMTGALHVQPAGTAYPHDQAFYNARGVVQFSHALGDGARLQAQGLTAAVSSPGNNVTAGTGDETVFVARFLPGSISVKTGQTVVWTNRDPETPHTVTFGEEPPGGVFGTFAPQGVDGQGHATISSGGQAVNSGFLGTGFPFGKQFAVTFQRPGDYSYICALHDEIGMKGVVHVHS